MFPLKLNYTSALRGYGASYTAGNNIANRYILKNVTTHQAYGGHGNTMWGRTVTVYLCFLLQFLVAIETVDSEDNTRKINERLVNLYKMNERKICECNVAVSNKPNKQTTKKKPY